VTRDVDPATFGGDFVALTVGLRSLENLGGAGLGGPPSTDSNALSKLSTWFWLSDSSDISVVPLVIADVLEAPSGRVGQD
jgi:hypothetical protein